MTEIKNTIERLKEAGYPLRKEIIGAWPARVDEVYVMPRLEEVIEKIDKWVKIVNKETGTLYEFWLRQRVEKYEASLFTYYCNKHRPSGLGKTPLEACINLYCEIMST